MTATRLEAGTWWRGWGWLSLEAASVPMALRSLLSAGLGAMAPKHSASVSLTLHGACSHHFSLSLKTVFMLCLNYLSPLYLHVAGIKVLKI